MNYKKKSSMLKTNQFSFIGKYKVWTYLNLIKLIESGGTILDVPMRYFFCGSSMFFSVL